MTAQTYTIDISQPNMHVECPFGGCVTRSQSPLEDKTGCMRFSFRLALNHTGFGCKIWWPSIRRR